MLVQIKKEEKDTNFYSQEINNRITDKTKIYVRLECSCFLIHYWQFLEKQQYQ